MSSEASKVEFSPNPINLRVYEGFFWGFAAFSLFLLTLGLSAPGPGGLPLWIRAIPIVALFVICGGMIVVAIRSAMRYRRIRLGGRFEQTRVTLSKEGLLWHVAGQDHFFDWRDYDAVQSDSDLNALGRHKARSIGGLALLAPGQARPARGLRWKITRAAASGVVDPLEVEGSTVLPLRFFNSDSASRLAEMATRLHAEATAFHERSGDT
jgi:hypothetical protein